MYLFLVLRQYASPVLTTLAKWIFCDILRYISCGGIEDERYG